MFRKGGDVGGGIMNNIVERGQYANSNAEDLNLKDSTGLKIKDQMDVIEQLSGGDNRLGDPLTQFLLQFDLLLMVLTVIKIVLKDHLIYYLLQIIVQ